MYTRVKTEAEIAAMRRSGQLLAAVLKVVSRAVQPGISTKALADLAAAELKKVGGRPAFLGYHGFPDVLCVSLNDEVVHGIPRADRIIKDGDLVSLDFGVVYQGMITDSALSLQAGQPNPKLDKLIKATETSLLAGIDVIKSGVHVGDVSFAIENVLAKAGYGVVRDLVGHGVGHELHEEPNIPNYGSKGVGPSLLAGMTIAVEPMATLGGHEVYVADDKWTVKTRDGSLAAHFEHTILITADGAEILTVR